jgi:hypothetical protein
MDPGMYPDGTMPYMPDMNNNGTNGNGTSIPASFRPMRADPRLADFISRPQGLPQAIFILNPVPSQKLTPYIG